jgi:hypothetical protein
VLFLSLPYGGIEEEYKTIKCAIEEESFTGRPFSLDSCGF